MKIKSAISFPGIKKANLWRQISSLEAYPNWNPIIKNISGKLEFESVLDISLALPGSASKTVKAIVTGFVEGKYLSFMTRSPQGKWWFQSEYIFRIFQREDGNPELIIEVFCYGLRVRFFRPSVKQLYQKVADTLIRAIKHQVDSD